MTSSEIEIVPVARARWPRSHEVFAEGYSDYPVDLQLDWEGFESRIRSEGVRADLSYLASLEGRDVGLALVCEQGANRRLAALCVAPHARRRGAARALLSRVIAELEDGQSGLLSLEVLEENAGARALYRAMGFRERRLLHGYRIGRAAVANFSAGGQLCSLSMVPENVFSQEADLPWPARIGNLREPGTGVQLIANADRSVVAAVRERRDRVVVLSVVDLGGKAECVSAFAQSLIATYGTALRAPPLYPSGYLRAFFRYWEEDDVRQIEMVLKPSGLQPLPQNDCIAVPQG